MTNDTQKKLLHFCGDNISSLLANVQALDETEEWQDEFGESIHKLISDYDRKSAQAKATAAVAKKTVKALTQTAGSFSLGQFVISTQETYGAINRSNMASGSTGTSRQVCCKTDKQ